MTARDYTAKAAAVVAAGAAIKSRIKEALEDLSRAYDKQREVIMKECLEVFRNDREEGIEVNAEADALYYAMPYSLAHFRTKHVEMIRKVFGSAFEDVITNIENLVALRNELKSVEVAKFEKTETTEDKIKARVLKSFAELSAENKAQFDWASAIIREMNEEFAEVERMPVYVNTVFCQNYHGTMWVRIDWYFEGQKTAFNIIAAAAQKIMDEKKGK